MYVYVYVYKSFEGLPYVGQLFQSVQEFVQYLGQKGSA
jgi:hypothetical protein